MLRTDSTTALFTALQYFIYLFVFIQWSIKMSYDILILC